MKLPSEIWTEDIIQKMKDDFRSSRPAVPQQLAHDLWYYWSRNIPDQALFEEQEHNVALLIHARAFGEDVPDEDQDSYYGRLLREHKAMYQPLPIRKLTWGPSSVLSPEILTGLASPIMHAWIIVEGNALRQVLIIGEGLPEIRAKVFPAVFMASLQVHALPSDLMNIGILRVELPGSPVMPFDLPFNMIGDRQEPLSVTRAETADQVLADLVVFLQELAQNTGLVEVHTIQYGQYKALANNLRQRVIKSQVTQPVLWTPKERTDDPTGSEHLLILPYWHLPSTKGTLSLGLSPDLLLTKSYNQLENAYYFETMERILATIRTRREFYKLRADGQQAELSEYERATPRERLQRWGAKILASETFDNKYGISKKTSPEEIDTDVYFRSNVPHIIEEYRGWQHRMEQMDEDVTTTANRPDAPVQRFAISRFLDAAIREVYPDESKAARNAFDSWRRQIQPLLWLEWRAYFQRHQLRERFVLSPHTFFHTWLTSSAHDQSTEALAMTPYSLFDRYRSLLLIDHTRRVAIPIDASDYARNLPDQQLERMLNGGEALNTADQDRWNRLRVLANKRGISKVEFFDNLRQAIQESPYSTVELLLAALFHSDPEGRNLKTNAGVQMTGVTQETRSALKNNLYQAELNERPHKYMQRAYIACQYRAYQTARVLLESIPRVSSTEVYVALMQAFIECLAQGLNPYEELPISIQTINRPTDSAIMIALRRAQQANQQYTNEWLEEIKRVANNKHHENRPIKALIVDIKREIDSLSTVQQALLFGKEAVVMARLARDLEQVVGELPEERALIEMAYARVGRVLELIEMEAFSKSFPDFMELISVLTGHSNRVNLD